MVRAKLALVLFWIGLLALFGAVAQGAVASAPYAVAASVLLCVPYVYMHVKRGKQQAEPQAPDGL